MQLGIAKQFLLSAQLMDEYRAVLLHPAIPLRFPKLNRRRVEFALHRLRYIADEYKAIRVKFELERDPRDAMFVELAIAGAATHIIILDQDLLSLPTARQMPEKDSVRGFPAQQSNPQGTFFSRVAMRSDSDRNFEPQTSR